MNKNVENKYLHICTICGKDFSNNTETSYKCQECEKKLFLIKKLEMLQKAENILTKTRGKIRLKIDIDLTKEMEKIKTRVASKIDNFASIPEAVVAIQLEYKNIKYISQKEIAGYKVDFYLPELKIMLEVDGQIYHVNENESFIRDRKIMNEIGEEFEIIHIDSDTIPRYTWNLGEALPFIVSQRNEQKRFRNSMNDTYFLEKFRNMELYLKVRGR